MAHFFTFYDYTNLHDSRWKTSSLKVSCHCFFSDPYEVFNRINRVTKGEALFFVLIRSSITNELQSMLRSKYRRRSAMIRKLFSFWKENYETYSDKGGEQSIDAIQIFFDFDLNHNNLVSFQEVVNDSEKATEPLENGFESLETTCLHTARRMGRALMLRSKPK